MRYQDADLAIRTQLSDHLMVALLGLIYSLIAAREPQFYFLLFSSLLGSIFSPILLELNCRLVAQHDFKIVART